MKNNICFILFFLTAISSCQAQQEIKGKVTYYDSLEVLRVIPYRIDSNLKESRASLFLTNLAKLIGLDDVTSGRDSLYIRLWVWDSERKYVISIDTKEKKCQISEFSSGKGDGNEYIIIFHEWKKATPQSGWEKLTNAINEYKIPLLESGTIQKKQKQRLTEMAYAQFEISVNNKYRFYEYLEPSFYRFVDNDSKLVFNFLNFLCDQFRVYFYKPADKLFIKL